MWGRVIAELWEVALDHHGFVTAADAAELGIPRAELGKLAHRGRVQRVGHGIYRFPQIPPGELDQYMLATLWPAGRGVLSHETALQLHELCDVNPDRIHITIPPGYYPRRGGEDLYVVHHETLDDDVTWIEGIRIVTPGRAIRQAIATGVPPHLVQQAIATARRLGRVPAHALDVLGERLVHSDA